MGRMRQKDRRGRERNRRMKKRLKRSTEVREEGEVGGMEE